MTTITTPPPTGASQLGRLRRMLFGISPTEASFEKRGFRPCDPRARERLETIGRTFIRGYLAALEEEQPARLAATLDAVDRDLTGFAYEGAAMGLALLDHLLPWRRNRLEQLIGGPGHGHAYMIHVGAGWALARLGRSVGERGPDYALTPDGPDPLLRWLMVDGYGFHEGYFHWRRAFRERRVPERIAGYGRRAYDQGLGRCLWFVEGADPGRAAAAIASFPQSRQADLWSGVGLASTYAGGADREGLQALLESARDLQAHVSQGACFAAKARIRAHNATPETELACAVLCDMTAERAAAISDEALVNLPADGAEPAYETWRGRVRARFCTRAGK